VKKAEDDHELILRFYEWAGSSGTAQVTIPPGATSAALTNLMERPEGAPLVITGGRRIVVPIHPYEIRTIEVKYPTEAKTQ
jgi:alpha-mannosidase